MRPCKDSGFCYVLLKNIVALFLFREWLTQLELNTPYWDPASVLLDLAVVQLISTYIISPKFGQDLYIGLGLILSHFLWLFKVSTITTNGTAVNHNEPCCLYPEILEKMRFLAGFLASHRCCSWPALRTKPTKTNSSSNSSNVCFSLPSKNFYQWVEILKYLFIVYSYCWLDSILFTPSPQPLSEMKIPSEYLQYLHPH